MSTHPPDRSHVDTERRNDRTTDLHALTVEQCVQRIHDQDRLVLQAMRDALPAITRFIEVVEPRFNAAGRLIYLGAGTSGRLGVLDASEMPPTFQLPPDRIVGIIAGGDTSLRISSESKEDDPKGALPELAALNMTANDTLLGIASGGTTPWVLGALDWACNQSADKRPLTALLTCTALDPVPVVDHLLTIHTGPEVITGSTRMKAGTATKLALNTISTTLMIRSGRVYENLMVDLRATNDKLRDRAARIIATLLNCSREDAFTHLDAAHGNVKVAVLMQNKNCTRNQAQTLLTNSNNRLDRALQ